MTLFEFIGGALTAFTAQLFFKLACKCKESCECDCMDGIITFKRKMT